MAYSRLPKTNAKLGRVTGALALTCLVATAAACGGTQAASPASTSPSETATTGTTAHSAQVAQTAPGETSGHSGSPSASPSPTGTPGFTSQVSGVTRDEVKYSWRPGCPVGLDDLRKVTLTYWGFDDKPHTGELVVNKAVTKDIETIFKRLYDWRFPIAQMKSVDAYKGSDFDSIEVNNTSAFNCRPATGSSKWSMHAYGRAIDINPRENPYVSADGSVAHTNARRFVKRPLNEPGVINPGDRVVRAFESLGWEWGGYWSSIKDYQHFSKGGG
ncbi:D-alanyl-D-alanine carboxypeptidase [Sinosporangium album]|uniref:D-alanyl-D-alanine carboxypeptidase n=1 Tax=Sinosporangium album TaxID=504805 RepID=A0A1G8JUZ2_9ACTN|nr:M15 family metallopeptidase [Sinosporangium album]SDI34887.1 D-alanyl-D-alanine carboxypeptidase [Sinosporangium album]